MLYCFVRNTVLIIVATVLLQACHQTTKPVLTNGRFAFKTTDSIHLKVEIAGSGYPCIFVHGGPGGGYYSFQKLGGDQLESCLQMIYYDQRGSGNSDSAKNYSLTRMISDIEELRDSLRIDKMYLMCHSFGGTIATAYALAYPQHVKGLILVNATLHFFDSTTLQRQIMYGFKLLGKDTVVTGADQYGLLKQNMAMRKLLSKQRIGYKFLTDSVSTIVKFDELDEKYPRSNDFAYHIVDPLLDSSKTNGDYKEYMQDFALRSPAFKGPVLVVTGSKDYAAGIDHYKTFHFPRQTLAVIPGGHLLYYENTPALVNAVCTFVKATQKE